MTTDSCAANEHPYDMGGVVPPAWLGLVHNGTGHNIRIALKADVPDESSADCDRH